jgi:hypothetical protein
MKDRGCYNGRVYMLDPDQLAVMEVEPLGPMGLPGMSRWERLQDTDAYWSGVRGDANLIAYCRNKVGAVLVDLSA